MDLRGIPPAHHNQESRMGTEHKIGVAKTGVVILLAIEVDTPATSVRTYTV